MGRLGLATSELSDLFASLRRQFDALERAASRADTHVTYIKPHGALYNAI
ncbi:MAG: LamB/YcsF family protein, partial [Planctomycetota bacterium]